MNYGCIKPVDIANGSGVRVSIFVSGCRNHCEGCFQPETWNFEYGQQFTIHTVSQILELLKPSYITGLSVLGGDPFEPENRSAVCYLCHAVRDAYPNKSIWVYTGYKYEDLKELPVFQYIDVLVDGPFEEDKKNISLAFRGSSNQRIIDVKTGENICQQLDHSSL